MYVPLYYSMLTTTNDFFQSAWLDENPTYSFFGVRGEANCQSFVQYILLHFRLKVRTQAENFRKVCVVAGGAAGVFALLACLKKINEL